MMNKTAPRRNFLFISRTFFGFRVVSLPVLSRSDRKSFKSFSENEDARFFCRCPEKKRKHRTRIREATARQIPNLEHRTCPQILSLGVRRLTFLSAVKKEHPRIPICTYPVRFNRQAFLPFSTVARAQFVAIIGAIGRNFGSRPAE